MGSQRNRLHELKWREMKHRGYAMKASIDHGMSDSFLRKPYGGIYSTKKKEEVEDVKE